MDSNLINELGLGANLSQSDLTLINSLFTGVNSGGKMPKISAKERNNLISKLSSFKTIDETPKKELKDMNEEEKKNYKNELKKKLKNKCNEKKLLRTSNTNKKNEIADSVNDLPTSNIPSNIPENLAEMMKSIDINSLTNELNSAENVQSINSELKSTDCIQSSTTESTDKLDDYIN